MNEKEKINPKVKYERVDVSAKWLAALGVLIVITAIVLHFILWGIYGHLEETAGNGAPIPESKSKQNYDQPRPPQLEPNAVENYKKYRAEENEKLNGYGWVNKEKGIVRIPIGQAMKILAQKGLPEVKTENQNAGNAVQNQNANVSNQMPINSQNLNETNLNINGRREK